MSFKDIKGQDKPIQILKEYIKSNRLTGSYLFMGEMGVGKKLIAKTLAKTLNCNDQILDSCDKCTSCLRIEKDGHPDVHCIDTEGSESIKIEYIRQLQKDIHLKPYEARQKVFIIDNAHNLTQEASNALLRVLEEPPGESLIILVSAKSALLFKTIISRCKIIKFHPLKRTELEEILRNDYFLQGNLAHFLAYFCEGRLGWALRLKDTDILREKNRVIDELALTNAVNQRNYPSENRDDLRNNFNILAGLFRDIYLMKIGAPCTELINLDRKDELSRLMNHYTWFQLDNILNAISNSLLYLEQNINTKLLISNLRQEISYGALK